MAEVRDDEGRVDLYRKLLNDPATRTATAKLSYKQWESKLLNDDNVLQKVADYATKKNWALDADDFLYKYAPEKAAPPTPKPQAAPKQEFMEAPSLEEQEAYVPEPQPLVGSPEYDKQLQKQYGGMAPTLGATFGGVPAAFETKEQKKQEQLSPAFKAQQLAFEDVPIAEEQRRAQKQFAKATKQQQQAALRGGTGFELQQERADEARESTEKLKDFGSYIGATFDNAIDKLKGAERIFAAKQRALLTFGDREKKAKQEEKKVKQDIYNYISQLDQDFAAKQADYNIEGNLFDVIRKGQLDRIPEAFAYNLAQIGINALGAGVTGGYSTFAQVMPDIYKAGVEEIARKTKTTPEQVIASGNDKEVLSYIGGGVSGYLDYLSSGIFGQTMRSVGAYKFLRDMALNKIGKTKWKQAAASAAALGGVSGIEGATELGQGLVEVATPQVAAADTFKEARENIYQELQKPETQRRLAGEFVGGLAGGGAISAGGRALSRALEGDFTYGDVRKAPQRADYDVVQTDNKIQERNKIAQAMEEAVKANPEAEGQIRQQYQKRINEAAPTDEEVLSAYDGLAVLPETEEKNTIRENLEAYMAEKGIQPEPIGMEAGLGEGLRVTSPIIQTVNADFPPPQPPTSEEEVAIEEAPAEEELSLEDQLMGLVPQEETAPAPAEEEVVTEEEVTPEAVPLEPVAQKETQVGGIVRGYENISGSGTIGDIRNELPDDNSGTLVLIGADGNQYAVSYSRKGGDGENIFEQGASTPRGGHIYTAVQIQDTNNAQEVEQAKRQAETSLASILPTVKKGKINKGAVEGALQTAQAAPSEVVSAAPVEEAAPEAPVTPPAATPKKEAAPKPEPKKEAPKEEKPVSGTPQEGDKVEIAPQREGGSPRNMVFKDGEWKQNVGGDIVKVGPAVQQQAQEAFGGKAEVKPAETKEGKKAEVKEEKVTTPEFTSQQSSEAATAFDKAKTSKGFDKKYGKGAYKALSDITKNFDAIMDKVSDKIKQDCL